MHLSSYGEIKIAVVSNVTIEPFFSKKIKNYIDGAKVCFVPYDEYTYGIEQISNSDLILLWINLEVVFPDYCVDILEGKFTLEFLVGSVKSIYDDMLNRIAALGGKKVLIMLQDSTRKIEIVRGSVADKDDILRRFNGELVENYSKVVTLIDLDRIIANVGIKSAYDHVNRYRWNAIYTADLINEVAQEVYKQVLIGKGVTKKCIVLDCDNVLWGGVISEDGIEKIDIGNMGEGLLFQDFQRFLLEMYYNGVILAVASKNDCADIMNIFDNHSGMVLKKEHISCFEVNWNNKSESILKIANFLNIGLDSIVFVDDSQYEVNLVMTSLPEVTTILFDKNENFYSLFSCINLNKAIDREMIKVRNETYKTNLKREVLRQNSVNYQQFLKNLNTTIEIHKTTELELKRISELSLRTNRCTNGMRYTIEHLTVEYNMSSSNYNSVYVKDKFGDLGLVGAIIINDDTVDLFCLSCRALGREVENRMVRFILDEYDTKYIKFFNTYKNNEIKQYLCGYFDILKIKN